MDDALPDWLRGPEDGANVLYKAALEPFLTKDEATREKAWNELQRLAVELEDHPVAAVHALGVLANRLAIEVLQTLLKDQSQLTSVNELLTGEPNADYFVKLHIKAATTGLQSGNVSAEAEAHRAVAMESFSNIEADPEVAVGAALAIAVKLATNRSNRAIQQMRADNPSLGAKDLRTQL
jgi:hypothetical protein